MSELIKSRAQEVEPNPWDSPQGSFNTVIPVDQSESLAVSVEVHETELSQARDAIRDVFENEATVKTGDEILQGLIDTNGIDSKKVEEYMSAKSAFVLENFSDLFPQGFNKDQDINLPRLLQDEANGDRSSASLLDVLLQRKEVTS